MLADRTIRGTSRRLAMTVILAFVLAVGLVAAAMQSVRIGGRMDRQNRVTAEFVADIMPPALFLVEPMLHATWIVADPDKTAEHAAELDRLEKTYRERLRYWEASEVDPAFRERVVGKLQPLGEAFWKHVHSELVPAGHGRAAPPAAVRPAGQTPRYAAAPVAVGNLALAVSAHDDWADL